MRSEFGFVWESLMEFEWELRWEWEFLFWFGLESEWESNSWLLLG